MDAPAFRVLSLCSGIGALDLGLRIAVPTARTICYVEREAYCVAVLAKRMREESLDEAPVWSDLAGFDARRWRGAVDCVLAGWPCTPFSHAGKRKGENDERHLWPHVLRIFEESGASWLFGENVEGHLSLGLDRVCEDLEGLGARVAVGLFSAEEVGASHVRKRLFVLARRDSRLAHRDRLLYDRPGSLGQERGPQSPDGGPRVDPGDGPGEGDDLFPPGPGNLAAWRRILGSPRGQGRRPLPGIRRGSDGTADRLDRLRAIGNSVVPLVAARAFATLRASLESDGGFAGESEEGEAKTGKKEGEAGITSRGKKRKSRRGKP